MNRYVCIHSHFYQPPRENPWLEEVELQDSAYPYHDWNSRITAECYAPNTASRILGPERKIIDIVNNYSKISFNFGPTLLLWMHRHDPEVYQAILDADKENQKRFSGHGSAIAQAYNHMIMPLANSRDKRTQVLWGIRDFEYRFGRRPEGIWLPETAVDLETLDILSELGIKFTILAPRQARRVRKINDRKWKDLSEAKIDPKMPYLCKLPSERTIALFFYDGPISQDIAFGGLLENGESFAHRLLSAFLENREEPQLVHIATDGETYGHHHRLGDMALAYCLYYLEANNFATITNYGEYLEKYPPTHEVEIFENSSWSCIHGVERWKNDCGCNSGMHHGWNQQWRAPLRGAMDWLRDNLTIIYEEHISPLVGDPWMLRDDYIEIILNRSEQNTSRFLSNHSTKELTREEKVRVLKLLEMQRHVMLMYTSCGWFFDELSGIETVQVILYAARALQLAKETSGISLEEAYVNLLERAPSNIPDFKNGAKIYELFARPAVLNLLRVGVHYAISSLFKDYPETTTLYTFTAKKDSYDRTGIGKQKLGIGKASVRSDITLEEDTISFAVLHFGDHNIVGGARSYRGEEFFYEMQEEIKNSFSKSDIPGVIHLIDKHFFSHSYSLWYLFRDEQREILNKILESTRKEIESSFRQIYEHHYPVIQAVENLNIPFPKYFSSVAEFVLNTELQHALENGEFYPERFQKLVEEVKRWSPELDKDTLGFIAKRKIETLMEELSKSHEDVCLLEQAVMLLKTFESLNLELNLWKAQNIYFSIGKQFLDIMRQRAGNSDESAQKWIDYFDKLGDYLKVKIS
jgi:alpha-amylase/alpha-mannosidase (GH57 family)